MTDDEQDAADAAQMLRAHQQLYGALADFEAAHRRDGEPSGDGAMAERSLTAFEQINWDTLDLNAVFAFYEACGRPVEQRALLCGPVNPAVRQRCIADFKAMQDLDCPGCGN